MPNVKVNRKYKDRLFRLWFGMEEYKKDMLLLYNALNETTHENEKDLSITTCPLRGLIYFGNLYSQYVEANKMNIYRKKLQKITAVVSCIKDEIMAEFLRKHKAKVVRMCLTEFDEKVFADGMREEGKIEEKAESILELLEDYGEVSEMLNEFIRDQTDLEILRKWLKLATGSESIEDFAEKIGLARER